MKYRDWAVMIRTLRFSPRIGTSMAEYVMQEDESFKALEDFLTELADAVDKAKEMDRQTREALAAEKRGEDE